MDVEFGHDLAESRGAAVARDAGDPVDHQHRRHGQSRAVGAEQLARTGQQQLIAAIGVLLHRSPRA
jgi:hypothetical protein